MIVFTGLPGSGKSAIAESLATELAIPVYAKDWVEAPILKTKLVPPEELGVIGYDLLTALARRQLMLHQSVILDSVASTASIRSVWRSLAQEFDADWLVIECICSDTGVHRERLSRRTRNIPDWPELEWADVERVRSYFEPWAEDRLILDSIEPSLLIWKRQSVMSSPSVPTLKRRPTERGTSPAQRTARVDVNLAGAEVLSETCLVGGWGRGAPRPSNSGPPGRAHDDPVDADAASCM